MPLKYPYRGECRVAEHDPPGSVEEGGEHDGGVAGEEGERENQQGSDYGGEGGGGEDQQYRVIIIFLSVVGLTRVGNDMTRPVILIKCELGAGVPVVISASEGMEGGPGWPRWTPAWASPAAVVYTVT